jgi:hypothetical protein
MDREQWIVSVSSPCNANLLSKNARSTIQYSIQYNTIRNVAGSCPGSEAACSRPGGQAAHFGDDIFTGKLLAVHCPLSIVQIFRLY